MNPDHPDFQRAFVAAAYCAGTRGDALLAPFVTPSPRAVRLVAELAAEDRGARAKALAAELEILTRRLSQLGLRA
jgi:hypothetical protein